MIALTQESHEELIALIEKSLSVMRSQASLPYSNRELSKHIEIYEVALASLTAPVLGYIHKSVWASHKQAVCSGDEFGLEAYADAENHFAVYGYPPVLEIKLPKLSEGYPVSEWTQWYISEIKRLNGLND